MTVDRHRIATWSHKVKLAPTYSRNRQLSLPFYWIVTWRRLLYPSTAVIRALPLYGWVLYSASRQGHPRILTAWQQVWLLNSSVPYDHVRDSTSFLQVSPHGFYFVRKFDTSLLLNCRPQSFWCRCSSMIGIVANSFFCWVKRQVSPRSPPWSCVGQF